jgi:hypothetical protein
MHKICGDLWVRSAGAGLGAMLSLPVVQGFVWTYPPNRLTTVTAVLRRYWTGPDRPIHRPSTGLRGGKMATGTAAVVRDRPAREVRARVRTPTSTTANDINSSGTTGGLASIGFPFGNLLFAVTLFESPSLSLPHLSASHCSRATQCSAFSFGRDLGVWHLPPNMGGTLRGLLVFPPLPLPFLIAYPWLPVRCSHCTSLPTSTSRAGEQPLPNSPDYLRTNSEAETFFVWWIFRVQLVILRQVLRGQVHCQ